MKKINNINALINFKNENKGYYKNYYGTFYNCLKLCKSTSYPKAPYTLLEIVNIAI